MTNLIAKKCSKCKVLKGTEGFNKISNASVGYRSQCKSCLSVTTKKHRLENPDKMKARGAKYRLDNPDKVKATYAKWAKDNPVKVKERAAKYYSENSDKIKAKHAKYSSENPEKEKARRAKYKSENRVAVNALGHARRARLKGAEGRYDKNDWARILDEWDHKCAGCRCEGALAVDHIISLHMGGSNFPENLQPLCVSCNSSKNSKSYSFLRNH